MFLWLSGFILYFSWHHICDVCLWLFNFFYIHNKKKTVWSFDCHSVCKYVQTVATPVSLPRVDFSLAVVLCLSSSFITFWDHPACFFHNISFKCQTPSFRICWMALFWIAFGSMCYWISDLSWTENDPFPAVISRQKLHFRNVEIYGRRFWMCIVLQDVCPDVCVDLCVFICVYFVCFCFILHSCCIIVSRWGEPDGIKA